MVAAVTHHCHVELLWLAKNGASEAGALAVAPGLAQMRALKKYTCDFKDAVEVQLPRVTDAEKDDWNRRLKSLMGINEVNEDKKKRAEAAKVCSTGSEIRAIHISNELLHSKSASSADLLCANMLTR